MQKFKSMLAKTYEPEKLEEGAFIQPKLDGIRCYITKDGAFSRNNKRFYSVDHILSELEGFFADNPDFILDGELYNHEFKDNFNKIVSLVRKQETTYESVMFVQFHMYDILKDEEDLDNYEYRSALIKRVLQDYNLSSVKAVETLPVATNDEVESYHNTFKDQGYEGSIVRNDVPYKYGRSPHLMKVKDWSDTEITVTGFVEGKGKFSGGLGKFLGTDSEGREVEVPWPTLTILERQAIWENKEDYLGKLVTFEYFERTPAGAYRFPRAKTVRNYE